MSFTAAAGVPMSTRSGDVDPGLVWYLARTEGFVLLSSEKVRKLLFRCARRRLETFVFSGGIGENAPAVRALICDALSFFGITLDETRNMQTAG